MHRRRKQTLHRANSGNFSCCRYAPARETLIQPAELTLIYFYYTDTLRLDHHDTSHNDVLAKNQTPTFWPTPIAVHKQVPVARGSRIKSRFADS